MSKQKPGVISPLDGCAIYKLAQVLSKQSPYSRGSIVGRGFGLFAAGILFGASSITIYLLGFIAGVQIFLIPAAPVCAIWGLYKIIRGLASPQFQCQCARCFTNSPTLKSVNARPCTGCLSLIHITGKTEDGVGFLVRCPACGSESVCFGTGGDFRCSSCGTWLVARPNEASPAIKVGFSKKCPNCGNPLTREAFACAQCKTLVTPRGVPGLKTVEFLSFSPFGHLMHAKSRLSIIDQVICDDRVSQQSIEEGLQATQDALLSLEVIVRRDSSYAREVVTCVELLQTRYPALLAKLHQVLSNSRPKIDKLSTVMPAKQEKRVLAALREVGGVPLGDLVEWSEEAVKGYEGSDGDSFTGTKPVFVVKGFSGLLDEAKRLQCLVNKAIDSDKK